MSKWVDISFKIKTFCQANRTFRIQHNFIRCHKLAGASSNNRRYFAKQTRGSMEISTDQSPILKIANGLIRGLKRKTIYDDNYYGFEGIPYGHPPLDKLRFKSPQPANNWNGIRDCTDFKVKPLQRNYQGEIEGSEDCLYLNVYAKHLNFKEALPVLVWIFGGAFNTGSCLRSKFSPDYFMQEDVILVTLNYRLSTFGYLSFSDPSLDIPGNAGLKDQILALKWVRDNISYFGGNHNNVTIFGESAGGASIHYLMCTDSAKDLFHKAICMSGCIMNNWAFADNGIKLPYLLASKHGYVGPNNDRCVLKYLKSLDALKLLEMDNLLEETEMNGRFFPFVPSKEPYDKGDAVITKPLVEMMATSWANKIPLIIGGTSFEGLIKYPIIKKQPSIIDISKRVPEMILPLEVLIGKSNEEKKAMLSNFIHMYFKPPGGNQNKVLEYLDFITFRAFWHGIHRTVKSRRLHSSAPTYQYLFDFDSPTFNHHRKMFCGSDIEKGVAHADDLAYLFFSYYSWKLDRDSSEYLTIRRMIKMWTQFAKTSDPNCEYMSDFQWQSIEDSCYTKWLRISHDLKFEVMGCDFRQKLSLWNRFYGKNLI